MNDEKKDWLGFKTEEGKVAFKAWCVLGVGVFLGGFFYKLTGSAEVGYGIGGPIMVGAILYWMKSG